MGTNRLVLILIAAAVLLAGLWYSGYIGGRKEAPKAVTVEVKKEEGKMPTLEVNKEEIKAPTIEVKKDGASGEGVKVEVKP